MDPFSFFTANEPQDRPGVSNVFRRREGGLSQQVYLNVEDDKQLSGVRTWHGSTVHLLKYAAAGHGLAGLVLLVPLLDGLAAIALLCILCWLTFQLWRSQVVDKPVYLIKAILLVAALF